MKKELIFHIALVSPNELQTKANKTSKPTLQKGNEQIGGNNRPLQKHFTCVIADAPCYPGVKHVAGDMFENVPSGDAIFMKWILHDWDAKRCIKVLLNNCWKALPADSGKVIIVEFILPTETTIDPISRRIISADLLLLAINEGGKERTFQEFQALGKQSYFPVVKAFPCSHGISVIEFYKKP